MYWHGSLDSKLIHTHLHIVAVINEWKFEADEASAHYSSTKIYNSHPASLDNLHQSVINKYPNDTNWLDNNLLIYGCRS